MISNQKIQHLKDMGWSIVRKVMGETTMHYMYQIFYCGELDGKELYETKQQAWEAIIKRQKELDGEYK